MSDSEAERIRLFGASPIRPIAEESVPQFGERFVAEYRPRFSPVNRLVQVADQTPALINYSARYDEDRAQIKTESTDTLEQFFRTFQQADSLNPQTWVMRGVVVDAAGRAVPGVMVDLIGDYNQINGCRSRGDGTFFHVIDFAGNPPTRQYRSRFRVRSFSAEPAWRYQSASFTLTGGEVLQVKVTLPVALPDGDVVAFKTATAP